MDLYPVYGPIPSVQDFIGSLRLKMYIINSPKLKSSFLSCTVMNPTGLLRYISSRGSIILSVLDAVETCMCMLWSDTTQGDGKSHLMDL